MKIALIAPAAIPARTANSIQTMKMAQALTMLGEVVNVFVPGTSVGLTWDELARHYGLQHEFEMQWLPTNPYIRGYDYAYKAVGQACRWGADLIYTRQPQAAAWASLRGIPTLFEIHDIPSGKIGSRLFRMFLRGRGALRLVPITQALAKDLKELFGAPDSPPFTVIAPDGVDLRRYDNLPDPKKARHDLNLSEGFTAGYTGHLYIGRGMDIILSIAGNLPEINFLVVGGEPEDVAQVKMDIQALGLNNITLTGFVPNAELAWYQAACDILLMPYQSRVTASSGGDISRYLSPMKMFEYLACGRAILSSNLPVLQEVLSSENAVILPATDVNAWVTATQKLIAEPEHRNTLAISAYETAQRYTWEARVSRILDGLETP